MMTFNDHFSRGKTQVFYNFLPGKIIDYPGQSLAVRIAKWDSREFDFPSKKRIIRRIYEEQFPRFGSVEKKFPKKLAMESFYFGTPKKVYCELWPLVVRKQSNNETFFPKTVAQLGQIAAMVRKQDSNERLIQEDLVFVNKNGSIDSLHPIKDPRKVRHQLVLGPSQADHYWADLDTGKFMERLFGILDGVRINRAYPIRAAETYIPQMFTIVNQREIESLTESFQEDVFYLAIASSMGYHDCEELSSLSLKQKFDELKKAPGSSPAARAHLKSQLAMMGIDPTKVPEEKIKQASEVGSIISKGLRDANQQASKLVKLQPQPGRFLEELLEFLINEKYENTKKISVLAETSAEPEKSMYRSFLKWLNAAGIKDATYLEDVPLMTIAYGYTRGDFETKECMLKAFPSDDNENTKIPIYLNPTKTEAILFEIDKSRILEWLDKNKIAKVPQGNKNDEQQAWFFNNINVDAITHFEGVKEGDEITRNVFSLVHSISHALIKKIPEFCGTSDTSLGEVVFPNIPAIMIYSSERGNFRLGFLKDIFENHLHPLMELILRDTRKCAYDPVCIESKEGCCHVCLLPNEISCAYYNKALSRHYLYGDPKTKLQGFWEGTF